MLPEVKSVTQNQLKSDLINFMLYERLKTTNKEVRIQYYIDESSNTSYP